MQKYSHRNDDGHPLPHEGQTKIEQAFSIFVQRARNENRNYFGDLVRSNLGNCLQNGCSPQQAVDNLFRRVRR